MHDPFVCACTLASSHNIYSFLLHRLKNLGFGFKSGLNWSGVEFCALRLVGDGIFVVENSAPRLKSEARNPVLYISYFDGGLGFPIDE